MAGLIADRPKSFIESSKSISLTIQKLQQSVRDGGPWLREVHGRDLHLMALDQVSRVEQMLNLRIKQDSFR